MPVNMEVFSNDVQSPFLINNLPTQMAQKFNKQKIKNRNLLLRQVSHESHG